MDGNPPKKNVHEIILKVKGYLKVLSYPSQPKSGKITSCQAVKKLAKWERATEHSVDIDFHAFTSSVFESLPVGS